MKTRQDLRMTCCAAPLLWAGFMVASPARAGSADTVTPPAILSASDIFAGVRSFGLDPEGPAVRRGPYYVLHAFDGTGAELRIVADAQFGDIVFIGPAFNAAITPPYVRAARIIAIPAEDESPKR